MAVPELPAIVVCTTPPCTDEVEWGLYADCGHGPVLVCTGCRKRVDRWLVNSPDQSAVCATCRVPHARPLPWRRV
jgi:hypothetical protein